jgi:hypothetical protein
VVRSKLGRQLDAARFVDWGRSFIRQLVEKWSEWNFLPSIAVCSHCTCYSENLGTKCWAFKGEECCGSCKIWKTAVNVCWGISLVPTTRFGRCAWRQDRDALPPSMVNILVVSLLFRPQAYVSCSSGSCLTEIGAGSSLGLPFGSFRIVVDASALG